MVTLVLHTHILTSQSLSAWRTGRTLSSSVRRYKSTIGCDTNSEMQDATRRKVLAHADLHKLLIAPGDISRTDGGRSGTADTLLVQVMLPAKQFFASCKLK